MVVIGHRNKFYPVQQVKLISILENERAVLIEYSFHWQWWDIFPLLSSGVDHMKVDIPSTFPFSHCMESTRRKRDLRNKSEGFLKIKPEKWSLVEGTLQGTRHTIALSCSCQNNTGIRKSSRATGCWIIDALSQVYHMLAIRHSPLFHKAQIKFRTSIQHYGYSN